MSQYGPNPDALQAQMEAMGYVLRPLPMGGGYVVKPLPMGGGEWELPPVVRLSDADVERIARRVAELLTAAKETKQKPPQSCDHAGYTFAKHGRCCPLCGAFMTDFGD